MMYYVSTHIQPRSRTHHQAMKQSSWRRHIRFITNGIPSRTNRPVLFLQSYPDFVFPIQSNIRLLADGERTYFVQRGIKYKRHDDMIKYKRKK